MVEAVGLEPTKCPAPKAGGLAAGPRLVVVYYPVAVCTEDLAFCNFTFDVL